MFKWPTITEHCIILFKDFQSTPLLNWDKSKYIIPYMAGVASLAVGTYCSRLFGLNSLMEVQVCNLSR